MVTAVYWRKENGTDIGNAHHPSKPPNNTFGLCCFQKNSEQRSFEKTYIDDGERTTGAQLDYSVMWMPQKC